MVDPVRLPVLVPNDNRVETYLSCAECKHHLFHAFVRDGELQFECAVCHIEVTTGILAYLYA